MTLMKILGLIAIVTAPSFVVADVAKQNLKDMPLNPTSLEGVSSAMISGAMDAEGVFGAHAIMKDGSLFPPHTHPDARMSLILEGTMYLGVGEKVNPSVEQVFEAGTVALTPAGVSH